MTALSPADSLTAAAQKLRAAARAAADDGGGAVWEFRPSGWDLAQTPTRGGISVGGTGKRLLHGGGGNGGRQPAAYMTVPVGEFAALVHPGVGLAIARWLEATASEMGVVDGTEYRAVGDGHDFASWNAALAAARQLLGEAS